MGHESAGEITMLLQGWRVGDRKALLPLVYKGLQRLAHFQLRKERPDHTLQSAAPVNEAYLRDARKAQVVELRFFGGLASEETAEVLKVSAIAGAPTGARLGRGCTAR